MVKKYKGDTYEARTKDGRPCYRGPMKRAEVWAKVFDGTVHFFSAAAVKKSNKNSRWEPDHA